MQLIRPRTADGSDWIRQVCAGKFACHPDEVHVIHAPYRICPLGAHIDHQLGPVSAFATAQGLTLAYAINADRGISIESTGYPGVIRLRVDEVQARQYDWADYARGAVAVLAKTGRLKQGISVCIEGRLSESGLSSSAAVGLAYLTALARSNEIEMSPDLLVEWDRQIENDFLGLMNGILDPAAIVRSKPGHLTIIHCGSLEFEYIGQPRPFTFLAVYSGLREALIDSSRFNDRVQDCLRAGARLRELAGEGQGDLVPLGFTTGDQWRQLESGLPEVQRKRAAHFFTESQRVLSGASCWRQGDAPGFGRLMQASALSSIHQYETGSPELIHLFEVLNQTPGVYGARFCGAGFRGCCVALVEPKRIESILESVEARYLARYPGLAGEMWALVTGASAGLSAG